MDGPEDHIGDLFVEGFNPPKIASPFTRHAPKNLVGSVYPGETLNFATVVKMNSGMDAELWKKCISRVSGQASVHHKSNENVPSKLPQEAACSSHCETKKGSQIKKMKIDDDIVQDYPETKLSCSVVATYVGTNAKSATCLTDLDLGLDLDLDLGLDSGLRESSTKPHFRDESTYVIPMTVTLEDVTAASHFIELQVVLWLYTVSVQSSESSPEPEGPAPATKNSKPSSTQPAPTRISVAPSEFFDAESDEEEGQDNSNEQEEDIASGNAEISTGLPSQQKNISPVKVSSCSRSVQQKTVTRSLQVQATPDLHMRHAVAGQKQMLMLSVNNNAEKQMVIKSLHILSCTSPGQDTGAVYEEGEGSKWESCHHLVRLENPRKSHMFPMILAPLEQLDLIYRLHLSSVPAESKLSLRVSVKWTHAGATNEITTVYKLPKIRIRSPPFIVAIKCEEEVELGKTFYVTYTIFNQLHDFMRMRLYYNLENMWKAVLEKGGTEEDKAHVKNLRNAVVCHDPDIDISSCPRGACVPIRVGFQIHKPGLYEMSELMKVNLQYSFPETPQSHHTPPLPSVGHGQQQQQQQQRHHTKLQATNSSSSSVSATSEYGVSSSSSSSSPSLQSTDDPDRLSLLASEELWRGRSGSTASLATPPPASHQSAEEKRRSFASKSYSFGDFGPTASADSDQGDQHNQKPFKRSPAVQPSRPPPPRLLSQTERDLVRPSNFLKQPFYIHVRDPITM